jgi:hypothetical protein
MSLGLKRKFLFSYFRENLFSLFAEKAYEKLRKKRKCMRKRTQETGNIVKYLKMSNPEIRMMLQNKSDNSNGHTLKWSNFRLNLSF